MKKSLMELFVLSLFSFLFAKEGKLRKLPPGHYRSGNNPVHSFISGKVVMMKDQGTKHYGLSVLIKKDEKEDGKNIYYLLGHLSEYAPQLTINTKVYPGMVVGKVGNTGNCRTDGHALTPQERDKGLGSHLHLSLYKTESRYTALYSSKLDNFITKGGLLYNPFNHTEGRKYK